MRRIRRVVTTLPYTMAAGDGYISLAGLKGAGSLTLPDCTGQSGADVSGEQSAGCVCGDGGAGERSAADQRFDGSVTVPANGTVTLRDMPNPKTVSGCHWEM